MVTFVSFLKGINVGGHKKIKMEDLKKCYEDQEFFNVTTYIQSGNIVFSSKNSSPESIIKQIKSSILKKFGFEVEVILRTSEELKSIIATNPFPEADGNRAFVTLLSQKPKEIPSEAIEKVKLPSESYAIIDKEVYFFCPEGYGKTKLSNDFWEKKLKVTATSRNMNTMKYLTDLSNNIKP